MNRHFEEEVEQELHYEMRHRIRKESDDERIEDKPRELHSHSSDAFRQLIDSASGMLPSAVALMDGNRSFSIFESGPFPLFLTT